MAQQEIPDAVTTPRYVTCPCQYCSGKIEFDASGFDDGETRTIECPHCHIETIIFVPRTRLTAQASNLANLPSPRAVPPVIQDCWEQLQLVNRRVNFASFVQAVGWAVCGVCLLFILLALDDAKLLGWLLALAAFGLATGLPLALYGRVRGKKLRRELVPLLKRAEEEKAMRNAMLAQQQAAQRAAYSATPEYFAKCLAILRMNEKTTPATAADFIGQNRVKMQVEGAYQAAITSGKRPPHILLVGSQGMGTSTLALLFARAFLQSLRDSLQSR